MNKDEIEQYQKVNEILDNLNYGIVGRLNKVVRSIVITYFLVGCFTTFFTIGVYVVDGNAGVVKDLWQGYITLAGFVLPFAVVVKLIYNHKRRVVFDRLKEIHKGIATTWSSDGYTES